MLEVLVAPCAASYEIITLSDSAFQQELLAAPAHASQPL